VADDGEKCEKDSVCVYVPVYSKKMLHLHNIITARISVLVIDVVYNFFFLVIWYFCYRWPSVSYGRHYSKKISSFSSLRDKCMHELVILQLAAQISIIE
jgi:hypothetical protein